MDEFTVIFHPHNKAVRVKRGSDLLTAAVKAGIALTSHCGGEGLCGKCKVIVKKGSVKTEPSRLLSDEDKKKGVILACEAIIESDLDVAIPPESIEIHARQGLEVEEFAKGITLRREDSFKHSPLVKKIYLELSSPTHDDATGDLDRIYEALEAKLDTSFITTKLANVKHLGDVIRESGFKVTATVAYKDEAYEILAIVPGDTTRANFAFAFDIGTTTVTGQLVDLASKKIIGTRIAYNKQASFGSDVITRIIYASEPGGLEKLNEAVLSNLNEMITDLTQAYGIPLSDVTAIMFAGNMTMMHLLFKVDPSNIRKEPYVPTTTVFPTIPSSELGMSISPKGLAFSLPGVSTYIGGDVVAGVLACGLFQDDDLSLLVDIGTNGEMVLGNREWMVGVAASAGPAFEGSGLAFGMKAVKGAIQKARITPAIDVEYDTIDGDKAKGICGSGYIDLLCQMLKQGVIEKDGKIRKEIKSRRIRQGEGGYEFVVAFKGETGIGRDIVIQEDDIENLKRSKGAIYSAIMSVFSKVGKDISDVKKIYIAGGFGNYLDIENAIYIGLLPDVERKLYEFVGNSSLAGARLAILSHDAFMKAKDIYKNITYVDLSSEPNYMDEYIASLFFPHTDMRRFPSVRL